MGSDDMIEESTLSAYDMRLLQATLPLAREAKVLRKRVEELEKELAKRGSDDGVRV